jgi:hypothetical protein
MPIRDQFVAAMPFIAGIGIPIGVLLSGTALPIAYDLKGSVGELKSSAASIQRQLDAQDVQLRTLISEKIEAEIDPKSLLLRQGIPVAEGYSFAFVKGSIVVFPKTPEAEGKLVKSDYRKQEITPVISGYVLILAK